MKHDIIKTDNYLLIVNNEEIKKGDYCISLITGEPITGVWKKIIAHLPLNNSPILEGVDLLPPLEDEVIGQPLVDYVNSKHTQEECIGFMDGYNKAKEKYKYTEEDIKTLIGKIRSALPKHNYNHYSIDFDEFIQSLQQPKYPIRFECEIFEAKDLKSVDEDWRKLGKPKTTTNSQGQTQLVGRYIYE